MSSFDEHVVIDGKDHLLGRLAAVVAKQLLNGQKVTVVRCEQLNLPGPLFEAKCKYLKHEKSFLLYRVVCIELFV